MKEEDKLHLSRTFSCKHESYAFDLHYLCNIKPINTYHYEINRL